MEKYGDLITNGLDLLSFLLVTPELVRVVVTSTVSKAVALISSATLLFLILAFAIPPSIPLLRRLGEYYEPGAHPLLPEWLAGIIFLSLMGGITAFFWAATDLLTKGLLRHAFMIGAGLFFVSRLIAFYDSAVKVGLLPWAG